MQSQSPDSSPPDATPAASLGGGASGQENMAGTKYVETDVLQGYVVEAMRATRTSDATALAKLARLAPSTLTRILGAETRQYAPRRETLRSLLAASGVPLPPELAAVAQDTSPELPSQADQAGGTGLLATRVIPVHALIGTRFDGLFHKNTAPLEEVLAPPGLLRRRRVFAVRMPDASMQPWRRPNELVFIDPTWTVAEGDHALVEVNNGAEPDGHPLFAVRRFLGSDRRGLVYRLGRHWGSPEVEEVQRKMIPSMQRVLEWPEVTGLGP